MASSILKIAPMLAMLLLAGCASNTALDKPAWPAMTPDDVSVRPSLKQMVKDHPSLKVVLRVPNVTSNVTQAQTAQSGANLNGAYDEIEKKLFNAGFIVRDRALLSSLIDKEGITSYQEIQKRVDTDLIIDVSSLEFNDPGDWLVTKEYSGPDGQPVPLESDDGLSMGQAVATVEAKFIVVQTGEVGAIMTLRVPVCGQINCTYNYFDDGMGGDRLSMTDQNRYAWVYDENSHTLSYLWSTGSGPGTVTQAADLIAQKIVDVLTK
ncbi:MAG TPA: hypothetical protein VGN70_08180 [Gammaproteobacteria bacterium]|jgi:hypothetical protein